jgi:hypothetical protein
LEPAIVNGQGVAIGDRDFTPNSAAILDIRASNKGVLVPRVTYTERMYISANAESAGLLVYQTDKDAGFYYWDGLKDKPVIPGEDDISWARVATTGSYNDLTDKPIIPTHLSGLSSNEYYQTVSSETSRFAGGDKAAIETGFNFSLSVNYYSTNSPFENRPPYYAVKFIGYVLQ